MNDHRPITRSLRLSEAPQQMEEIIDGDRFFISLPSVSANNDYMSNFMWTRNIGHHLIESVELEIGGRVIDYQSFSQLYESDNPHQVYSPELLSKIQSYLEEIDEGDLECCICYENIAGKYVLPCDHDSICVKCISNLRYASCPLCRKEITDVTKK